MLSLTDNTENTQLAYNYEYNDNTTRVTRSDGFIKEVVQNEDEENKKYVFFCQGEGFFR